MHDLRHGNLVGAAIHERNAEAIHEIRSPHNYHCHRHHAAPVPVPIIAAPVPGAVAVVLQPHAAVPQQTFTHTSSLPVAQPVPQQPHNTVPQQPGISAQQYPAPAQPAFVLKTGMAPKDGGWVKNWKRRSFTLDGNALRYYDHGNLKGNIPLTLISEVREVGPHMHVVTRDRTYKVAPEDCSNSSWVEAIQHNLRLLRRN
jgi:hypothetical protein